MKNLCVLILALSSISAAAKKTIIAGHFNEYHPDEIIISYYYSPEDFLDQQHTQSSADIDASGNFSIVFDIDHPVSINCMAGDHWLFINKFINAGDSLWLGVDSNNINIEGIGARGLAMMFKYENNFLNRDEITTMNSSFGLPKMEFATYWAARCDSELAFYNKAFNEPPDANDSGYDTVPVPEVYRKAVMEEIAYSAAVNLIQFSFRGRTRDKTIYTDTAYMQYLKAVPFNNANALNCNMYTQFVNELDKELWSAESYNVTDSTQLAYLKLNQYRLRDSIARLYFTGPVYDAALYGILNDELKFMNYIKGNMPEAFDTIYNRTEASINNLGASFNDRAQLQRIKTRLQDGKSENMPAPDFTAYTADGKKVKLSDYKGKVVYADFWATSCIPCVQELPATKKLQKKYKEKDVVFLYISFDNNQDIWQSFLNDKDFTGTHLIEPKGFESEAANIYHIAGIPRYILVNRKGLLMSGDAPRPSTGPEALIDKALPDN